MKYLYYFFILSIVSFNCNFKGKANIPDTCESDTTFVVQRALNSKALDSIILTTYKDSTLKVIKTNAIISHCSLFFRGKEVVYLDSNASTMEIDPGDFIKVNNQTKKEKFVIGARLPSFKVLCFIYFLDKNKAEVSLVFRNQGKQIDFKLRRINKVWDIIKVEWGRI